MSVADNPVRSRYEAALASLVAKLQQDRTVLAAILFGSLSYDEVWDKSDIDLTLVTEEKRAPREYCLVEDGINIHTVLMPRSQFKDAIGKALHSSFLHSSFSKSRLLFTRDASLADLYQEIERVGARDREVMLLRFAASVLPALAKAEKWFHVKRDYPYAFLYILYCVADLAKIEATEAGEIVGREVIHQALRLNPTFFRAVYLDLVDAKKDAATVGAALDQVNDYLDRRARTLFRPVLDFLAEAGGPRSTTELDEHFKKRAQVESLQAAYEWLADKNIVTKVPSPLRLTEKSRVTVDEAAYYFDG